MLASALIADAATLLAGGARAAIPDAIARLGLANALLEEPAGASLETK